MKIYNSISELIGNTPMLRLKNIEEFSELEAELYAKVEFFNPAGSVKDRVAKEMIEAYEREGKLSAGATIIEPTSGNTGISSCGTKRGNSYARVARCRFNYRCTLKELALALIRLKHFLGNPVLN